MNREFMLGLCYMAGIIVAWEIYLHYREPISDQIGSWLDSTQGRFETFYAEWRRENERDGD